MIPIGTKVITSLGSGTIFAYNENTQLYSVKLDGYIGCEWFHGCEIEIE
jgi:hypothetical protein